MDEENNQQPEGDIEETATEQSLDVTEEETTQEPEVEVTETQEETASEEVAAPVEEPAQEVVGVTPPSTNDDEEFTFAPVVNGTEKQWAGQWYVLHTYSGYEDAVAESLKQRISSLDMQDKIFDVMVPKENQIEIKGGKRKIVEKKMFPGYVLVNMNVTHDSWFVVRNTPNVTGFIGTDTDPVPVDDEEIRSIFKRIAVEEPKYNIDLSVGDLVHIKDGPFKNYDGSVSEVDEERGKIKVLVSIFGRETPVELDFLQVKKV